jgi:hypothetical protein
VLLAHINEAALTMFNDPIDSYNMKTSAYFLGVMDEEDKKREYKRCAQDLEDMFHGLEPTVVTLV